LFQPKVVKQKIESNKRFAHLKSPQKRQNHELNKMKKNKKKPEWNKITKIILWITKIQSFWEAMSNPTNAK